MNKKDMVFMLDGSLLEYQECKKQMRYLEKDIKMYMSELYDIEVMGTLNLETSRDNQEHKAEIECRMNDGHHKTLEFDSREDDGKLFKRMLSAWTVYDYRR